MRMISYPNNSPEEPANPPEQPEPAENQTENEPPELAETPHAMARSSLPTPTALNIDATDLYSEWKHWMTGFEIYAIASDLAKKNDAIQTATMLYCPGPAVQCIFHMVPGDHKSLNGVKTTLSGYFAPKRNVVAKRYKFQS